ncbi:MAG: RNA polymerase sigma factor, partial [Solirubrobacteraceae bacterium]
MTDRGSVVGQSDDELIAGVRGGEAPAFEEIYDRYARGILAFCAHMLGSREAAEDALQLTFVSAYRSLRHGENNIALRPWLYTIARNRCLSELRGRRDAIGVDELASDHPGSEGLADQVQRREDLREMLDDMQRLPDDQRAALVLFELGDHPQREIASVLGVRTEKVKALVFKAREALVRGRQARQHPCGDIREQLAMMEGRVPARSLLRAHIDRCPGCQSFEHEVRHQRAALALILPVALAGELKTSILGSVSHGGGAVAAACGGGGAIAAGGGGGAVTGGSAVAAGAGACGSGAVVGGASAVGGVSAIGATAVSGLGGVSAVSAATAGGIASAGAGAVAMSGPMVAAATGLTAIGESVGVGGLSASGVVAKILTAAAIATVAASSGHSDHPFVHRAAAPATTRERLLASVPARRAARAAGPAASPLATPTPSPGTVTSTSA